MVLATLETRGFSFTAVGRDPAHAQRIMEATWNAHVEQTGARMKFAELKDDVNYLEVEVGEGFRDERCLVTGV